MGKIQIGKVYKNKGDPTYPPYLIPYRIYRKYEDFATDNSGFTLYEMWDIELGIKVYYPEHDILKNMELME